jgi:FAD/FMN-containing dehydrogenase
MSIDAAQRRAVEAAVARARGAQLRWTGRHAPSLTVNTEAVPVPAAVINCPGADGCAEVVGALHDAGVPIAVHGGGWSPGALGVIAEGVVISLKAMSDAKMVDDQRIRVQGGAVTGVVSAVLDSAGLATTIPVPSQPGVVGAALSGGVGFTLRRDGFVCDAMESARLITSTGSIIHVDDAQDPDLMWALRGGGSNFGVVADATFTARPQGRVHVRQQVIGLAHAADALTWYDQWSADLVPDATSVIMLRNAPPLPDLDVAVVGRPALFIATIHAGSETDASRELAPLTELSGRLADRSFSTTLHGLRSMTDAMFQHERFGIRTASGWSGGLNRDQVDDLVALAAGLPAGESLIEIAAMGGAVANPRRPSSALGRSGRHFLNAMAIWAAHDARDTHLAWFRESQDVIRRLRIGDEFAPSFADLDDIEANFPPGPASSRLAETKRRLDPDNYFHRNVNIAPAPHTGALE